MTTSIIMKNNLHIMTKRILLKKETLDKIQALKKLFNITKDTTYIEKLVNDKYDAYRFDLEDNKSKFILNENAIDSTNTINLTYEQGKVLETMDDETKKEFYRLLSNN